MSDAVANDPGRAVAAPAGEPITVRVRLGDRSYDALIGTGLLARAPELIEARLGGAGCAIVTDANVAEHHLASLERDLAARGRHLGTEVLTPGEAAKSFPVLARVCERLLQMGLERGGLVVALGGGVIGDLAGLAASLVRRGVRFVQVPTTLLAQVDSSVGGKTGINTPQGKNLVGTFHQPSLVLADVGALATLPPRQLRAGYVEAAKFGLLGDAAFFAWLESNAPAVLAQETAALIHAVAVSVQGKADVVARDETETSDRMLLNLGHTFGHALEAWAGFSDRLLHGEAVAIGICLAFELSRELGLVDGASVARVVRHFRAAGLPTRIADVPTQGAPGPDAATLTAIMGQDKKVRDGKLTFILARGIGEAFVSRDVTAAQAQEFLARRIAAGM
ncbi:MAG TPA: 3-dehydroquinate synthase [Hyphomicrobiaceae bacterium]|nr:3-dehydroquinate synthase [Hyphomicrobiaceae bacterium]